MAMDEVQVFNRQLAELEVLSLFEGKNYVQQYVQQQPGDAKHQNQLLEYFLLNGEQQEFKSSQDSLFLWRKLDKLFEQQQQHYQQHPEQALQLLSIGEKPRNPDLAAHQVAAYTIVASMLMSFDEFSVKR